MRTSASSEPESRAWPRAPVRSRCQVARAGNGLCGPAGNRTSAHGRRCASPTRRRRASVRSLRRSRRQHVLASYVSTEGRRDGVVAGVGGARVLRMAQASSPEAGPWGRGSSGADPRDSRGRSRRLRRAARAPSTIWWSATSRRRRHLVPRKRDGHRTNETYGQESVAYACDDGSDRASAKGEEITWQRW